MELGEAPTFALATWYEATVSHEKLDDAAFARLEHNIEEKARVMATKYRKKYLVRTVKLIRFRGEPRARSRYVYRVSAYGRGILAKMRSGELPGAPGR